ncbi:MAG: DEAD/DEAH box helicase family protein [Candidatus Moraniibacteriota bacterium]
MNKEAQARIKINKLLEEAGWRFFDDENGRANIVLETNTKIKKDDLKELGKDFEKAGQGYVDFLLLNDEGKPYVVLEAKKEEKDPMDGKEQARRYAKSLGVRFVILSNGNLHYFWDLKHGNPQIISSFPTPDSMEGYYSFSPNPEALTREKVEADYIAKTQKNDYDQDPKWQNEEERDQYIKDENLKFLRNYQLESVHTLQEAVKDGKERFLFEMATGTGKTLISAAVIKLFLRTGNAKRVLFLVDRIELENQAKKSFNEVLGNDFQTIVYKENKDDWRKAEIVVSTVQSLAANNKYQKLFSPTDFDLVISDEAHRSISGNSRAVFEYFIGYKLGLTATPKDYLKKIDPEDLQEKDPRAWEKRQLLDTYKTFGCESGNPTFQYSLIDGVKDGFLVNPIVLDARTEITTQLLSDKGYFVKLENEEGELEEKTFYQKDFEKKFFSDKTNRIFCKTFIENALKDPISGEIGKSIIFCVSQKHAEKITRILNEFADKLYPGKYNSDFAVRITSSIDLAQQLAVNFANNNLNGHSKFLEGYNTSKTRVCVTVGMMTTGYDCQDILNLGLMRPVFSPTDFIQIKGRGTRKYNFKHRIKENGFTEEKQEEKDNFKFFDFFANCEYFEEKFDYDEVLELPKAKGEGTGGETDPVSVDEFTNVNPDPLKTLEETPIGEQGMRIDRELFQKFEDEIKRDDYIRQNYENGNYEEAKEYILENIFHKPEEYFDLEKLRRAARVNRRLSLREVLDKAFGKIDRFKDKDELLEEEFRKFVSIHKPNNEKVIPIKKFLQAYVDDPEFRKIIDENRIARLATYPGFSMEDLDKMGKEWKETVPEYVKDYVNLNTYM